MRALWFFLAMAVLGPARSSAAWEVQLGAFGKQEGALMLQSALSSENVTTQIAERDGLHRVLLPPVSSYAEGFASKSILKEKGFEAALAEIESPGVPSILLASYFPPLPEVPRIDHWATPVGASLADAYKHNRDRYDEVLSSLVASSEVDDAYLKYCRAMRMTTASGPDADAALLREFRELAVATGRLDPTLIWDARLRVARILHRNGDLGAAYAAYYSLIARGPAAVRNPAAAELAGISMELAGREKGTFEENRALVQELRKVVDATALSERAVLDLIYLESWSKQKPRDNRKALEYSKIFLRDWAPHRLLIEREYTTAMVQLAMYEFREGDEEGFVTTVEQFLQLYPNQVESFKGADPHDKLGALVVANRLVKGDYDGAWEVLQQYKASSPNYAPFLHIEEGMIRNEEGLRAAAWVKYKLKPEY